MSFYLLEIGSEELPSSFLPIAIDYLKTEAEKQLNIAHIPYNQVATGGTPRRVYLYINGLNQKQDDREDTVQGPPAKIAFNADGTLSDVGQKFIDSRNVDKDSINKITTDRGEYLSGTVKTIGKNTSEVLQEIVPNLIRNIPFPKSMRWGDNEFRFARPLHNIMSIWDENVLPIELEHFKANNLTVGHRFLSPSKIEIKNFEDYKTKLIDKSVVLEINDRINIIKKQVQTLANAGGYTIDNDEKLMNAVANLVEYPYAIAGQFDKEFLTLPPEVLTTSMKIHQRYFPTYKDNKLTSTFIGISNIAPKDSSLIREGYEKVLRARLNDAMFFYNNDINFPLEERVVALKKVIYQEKLGTSYEKMERFREIAKYIASVVATEKTDIVYEVATLAKADLMCEMVFEFPELQGYMGNIYAKHQGKTNEVSLAIEEHYMPRFAGDQLPSSTEGKIVAIADKLDTIVGAFAVGMIPSGNVDPYGLRRSTIGIINIIESANWNLDLNKLINKALELVKSKATEPIEESADRIHSFFVQRHKQIATNAGIDADAFDAAAVEYTTVLNQTARAKALTAAKTTDDFHSIAQSYKRINNILRRAEHEDNNINPALFEQAAEKVLFDLYNKEKSSIQKHVELADWSSALVELAHFADPLDKFFEDVMVMADDEKVKNNRLSLMRSLHSLFITVGDLSQIL